MSYVERTAKKLLPILQEVKKRMIPDKRGLNQDSDLEHDDENMLVDLSKIKSKNIKGKNQN